MESTGPGICAEALAAGPKNTSHSSQTIWVRKLERHPRVLGDLDNCLLVKKDFEGNPEGQKGPTRRIKSRNVAWLVGPF